MSVVDIFEKCAPFSIFILIPTLDSKAFYNLKNRDFRDYKKSFNAFLHSLKKGEKPRASSRSKKLSTAKNKKAFRIKKLP